MAGKGTTASKAKSSLVSVGASSALPEPSVLADAFGSQIPARERLMWASMSPERQAETERRLSLLLLAERSEGELSSSVLAEQAGLSLNRWYEMHRQWREKRSLSSLGTAASTPRNRLHAYHNELQRLVVRVVDAAPKAKVKPLATALGEAFLAERSDPKIRVPKYNTLRKFVEQELRRRDREERPGNELQFDCCACTLPYAEGEFVAYLVLDKATGAILGGALGNPMKSHEGYASAAQDALSRLTREPFTKLAWAERLERSEIVIGLDEDRWSDHEVRVADAGFGAQLRPSNSPKRFGRYARKLLGSRFGRVQLLPARTTRSDTIATPTGEDISRFGVEVDVYNAELFPAESQHQTGAPEQILGLLRFLTTY